MSNTFTDPTNSVEPFPVIIPAAGYGTRMLNATKSIPKELIPIINEPCIGYIADEIKKAGLKDIIIITSKNKDEIVDYFDYDAALEEFLRRKGKFDILENLNKFNDLNFTNIRQGKPWGNGHAILCAKRLIGENPLIVILPDVIVDNADIHLKLMIDLFKETGKGVIGLKKVPREKIPMYGIIKGQQNGAHYDITELVEKPTIEEAPSDIAILGRYVLPNKIMGLLDKIDKKNGEYYLTDALQLLAKEEGLIGVLVNDEVHDIGNPLGLAKATIHYGLKIYEKELTEYIKEKIEL